MNAQDKAKALVDQYKFVEIPNYTSMFEVKECALIMVDEIIKAIDWHPWEAPNVEFDYWELVKEEIQKL